MSGARRELRVWLDDDRERRPAPQGWIHVTTATEAIALLASGRVVELSLDHDLGDREKRGSVADVLDYLARQQEFCGRDLWPRDGITLRTRNRRPGRDRAEDPPPREQGLAGRAAPHGGRADAVRLPAQGAAVGRAFSRGRPTPPVRSPRLGPTPGPCEATSTSSTT
jgi:hypothetical protein